MGVIDSAWWSLWWPWLLVWAVTAGCLAVLLRHALLRLGRSRRRRRTSGRTVHGMCFFLHEKRVMDLYQQGGFSAALEQEVADRINVDSRVGVLAKLGWGSAGGHRNVTKETVTAYIKEETPITVIRLLMDTMGKEDVVVHADLTTGEVTPNRALTDTLRERGGDSRVELTSLGVASALSITGRFTARRAENGDIELRARYGTGQPAAQVSITCEASGVREGFQNADYFTGEFQARCLGKVPTWNRERGELKLNPIAVFL
ncbi:hypothetical protein [Streptomyces sp. NPDC018693]|uniref:hypothetical protein n=1 Tax=unclassified Streptomyces TaxID=2593676 RepID=UPI0037B23908